MQKEEVLQIVADNIRIERLKKKISQEKLAEMSGITQKYLNLIENSKANPSIAIVISVCKALEIDLNTIYKIQ